MQRVMKKHDLCDKTPPIAKMVQSQLIASLVTPTSQIVQRENKHRQSAPLLGWPKASDSTAGAGTSTAGVGYLRRQRSWRGTVGLSDGSSMSPCVGGQNRWG